MVMGGTDMRIKRGKDNPCQYESGNSADRQSDKRNMPPIFGADEESQGYSSDGSERKASHQRHGSSTAPALREYVANNGHCHATENSTERSGRNSSRNEPVVTWSECATQCAD